MLNACTGKNDSAAIMKITTNVMTPKVNVSVFNVPALSGMNFFCASRSGNGNLPDDRNKTAQNQDNTTRIIPEISIITQTFKPGTVVGRTEEVYS